MQTPTIFLIGFQKCGSSTLFDILIKHPKISGTNPKETFFLTDEGYDHFHHSHNVMNKNTTWNYFLNKPSMDDFILEASVCNFYQKNALNYIKSRNDSKVIFIVRDPVQRFISVYKYLYGKIGGIPVEDSIDVFYNKVKNKSYEKHILKYAIEHGKYCKYITLWEQEIGSENVHIFGFKDLIQKSKEKFSNLFSFLDLELSNEINEIPSKNTSKGFMFPKFNALLVKYFGGTFISTPFIKNLYFKYLTKKIIPVLSDRNIRELKCTYASEYKSYSHLF